MKIILEHIYHLLELCIFVKNNQKNILAAFKNAKFSIQLLATSLMIKHYLIVCQSLIFLSFNTMLEFRLVVRDVKV
jgi:hypothetical protein